MNPRRVLSAFLLLALVVAGVSCSSGEHKSNGTGATKTTDTEAPETTLSDADFMAKMESVRAAITAAGTDKCALSDALEVDLPDPENTNQTKEYVRTYVLVLDAVAGVLGRDSDNGRALHNAAEEFEAAAAKQKYSEDLLDSDAVNDIMTSDDVSDANEAFGHLAKRCDDEEQSSTTGQSPTTGQSSTTGAGGEVPAVPPVFGQQAG